MSSFRLRIVTPDGLFYNGKAEQLTIRTSVGEVGILAGHTDYVTTLGMGRAKITLDGVTRHAACIGGLLTVNKGDVTVVATTFEWAEDIDRARAERAAANARTVIEQKNHYTKSDILLAEARLKRALVRISCAK